jgi:3-oxoacyl-(acyl-carrier-protein) synthase
VVELMTTQTYDQRGTFQAGPDLGPAMTAADASDELVERGFDREQAQATVAGYLDATSRELGCSVHQWGLDDDDLDHITAHRTATGTDMSGLDASDDDLDEDGWGR